MFLATALAHVHDLQGEGQLVRALIDRESESSFTSQSSIKKLKLPTSPVNVTIHGVRGVQASLAKGRTTIKVSSWVDSRFSRIVDSLILPSVTSYQPSVQTFRADWTHLFGANMADSYEAFQAPVKLRLGADIFAEILHERIRRGPIGTPVEQQTAVG